ncbi:MAG: cytochrome c-type biogenesis protein [Pseudomonadota bacterium]
MTIGAARRWSAALLACLLVATPLAALQPDEILDDPALEARARALSKELRCLVCQNESIDASDARIARDLRLLVRARLVAGDSDAAVLDFIVARYGEYVLLNPRATGANLILWVAGPVMLLTALGIGGFYLRRRAVAAPPEALTEDETARLREILKE